MKLRQSHSPRSFAWRVARGNFFNSLAFALLCHPQSRISQTGGEHLISGLSMITIITNRLLSACVLCLPQCGWITIWQSGTVCFTDNNSFFIYAEKKRPIWRIATKRLMKSCAPCAPSMVSAHPFINPFLFLFECLFDYHLLPVVVLFYCQLPIAGPLVSHSNCLDWLVPKERARKIAAQFIWFVLSLNSDASLMLRWWQSTRWCWLMVELMMVGDLCREAKWHSFLFSFYDIER